MRQIICILTTVTAFASAASAQTPVQWTSTAKVINGNCTGGATAEISETPGKMSVKTLSVAGKLLTSFEVVLKADGSGRADTTGANGRMIFEIPPGVGKRGMKNSQVDGTCQWQWTPK
jgi:hypothetical protein